MIQNNPVQLNSSLALISIKKVVRWFQCSLSQPFNQIIKSVRMYELVCISLGSIVFSR